MGFDVVSVVLKRNGSLTYLPGKSGDENMLILTGSPRPFNVNLAFPLAFANADYASLETKGEPGFAARVLLQGEAPLNRAETRAQLTAKAETPMALYGVNPDQDQMFNITVRGAGQVILVALGKATAEEVTQFKAALKEKYADKIFLVYSYEQLSELDKKSPNPVINVLGEI